MTFTPKIYVTSLSDYNAGILHGKWIELSFLDADDIQEEINKMLAESKQEDAEEWAIHGFEDMPNIGEFENLKTIAEIAENIEKHGEAYLAAWNYYSNNDDALDAVTDRYHGEWASFEEYAEHFLEDCGGLSEVPEHLQAYIDIEHYARDLEYGYTVVESSNYTVFIFSDV